MGFFDKITSTFSSDDDSNNDTESDNVDVDPFSVPEERLEGKVNVARRSEIIATHYQEVSPEQAQQIAEILESYMTDTDGYRQREIRTEVEEEIGLSSDLAERIVWTETSSVEICDTVSKYREQMASRDDEWLFTIPGGNDDRTHPIREEVKKEAEAHGGLPLDELQSLFKEKAEKYQDEGGTPERMDHWVAHEKPRYTIHRKVT